MLPLRNLTAVVVLAAWLAACAEPVPEARAAYVGDWRAEGIRLLITPDGRVDYERKQGSKSTSIQAPIQRFEGDNIVVGIGPLNTTFVVSKAPHQQEGIWRMVVDGVELTRRGHPGDQRV